MFELFTASFPYLWHNLYEFWIKSKSIDAGSKLLNVLCWKIFYINLNNKPIEKNTVGTPTEKKCETGG